MARALAADPPVLLMDEPFSAVDPIVRASLQDQLLSLQAELRKTIVLVTHDIEEAIKVGDLVALFRPHGTLAQLAPPEQLLARARRRATWPASSASTAASGGCRSIRTTGLALGTGQVLPADATVAKAPGRRRAVDPRHRRAAARRAAGPTRPGSPRCPATPPLGQAPAEPLGHTFTVGTDSLRAALDAAVLSPAGQAVGVDDDGRVLGVASFDQLRAAIRGR